jgi:hypothetical protein
MAIVKPVSQNSAQKHSLNRTYAVIVVSSVCGAPTDRVNNRRGAVVKPGGWQSPYQFIPRQFADGSQDLEWHKAGQDGKPCADRR